MCVVPVLAPTVRESLLFCGVCMRHRSHDVFSWLQLSYLQTLLGLTTLTLEYVEAQEAAEAQQLSILTNLRGLRILSLWGRFYIDATLGRQANSITIADAVLQVRRLGMSQPRPCCGTCVLAAGCWLLCALAHHQRINNASFADLCLWLQRSIALLHSECRGAFSVYVVRRLPGAAST